MSDILRNLADDLEAIDAKAASVAKTDDRVTLDFMMSRVVNVEYINPESKPSLTIAVVTHVNGYVFTGESAPADPANFNEALGKERAFKKAIESLWALEAFALRERMTARE